MKFWNKKTQWKRDFHQVMGSAQGWGDGDQKLLLTCMLLMAIMK